MQTPFLSSRSSNSSSSNTVAKTTPMNEWMKWIGADGTKISRRGTTQTHTCVLARYHTYTHIYYISLYVCWQQFAARWTLVLRRKTAPGGWGNNNMHNPLPTTAALEPAQIENALPSALASYPSSWCLCRPIWFSFPKSNNANVLQSFVQVQCAFVVLVTCVCLSVCVNDCKRACVAACRSPLVFVWVPAFVSQVGKNLMHRSIFMSYFCGKSNQAHNANYNNKHIIQIKMPPTHIQTYMCVFKCVWVIKLMLPCHSCGIMFLYVSIKYSRCK